MLHIWTRQLSYHPHAHYIVPGVALASDGTLAYGRNPEFYLPVQVLSARFRNRMREALQAADPLLLATIPGSVWKKVWVVHSQLAGIGEKALEYQSHYIYKTAISSARLLWQDDTRVVFTYFPIQKRGAASFPDRSKPGLEKLTPIPSAGVVRPGLSNYG